MARFVSAQSFYVFSLAEEDDFKNLLFEDNLVTTSDTGKELGEFNVSITPTKHRGQECFLVHANSHGAIDSVPCGTSITAYVTRRLDTLEQQHHEYVKVITLIIAMCQGQGHYPNYTNVSRLTSLPSL